MGLRGVLWVSQWRQVRSRQTKVTCGCVCLPMAGVRQGNQSRQTYKLRLLVLVSISVGVLEASPSPLHSVPVPCPRQANRHFARLGSFQFWILRGKRTPILFLSDFKSRLGHKPHTSLPALVSVVLAQQSQNDRVQHEVARRLLRVPLMASWVQTHTMWPHRATRSQLAN